MDDYPSEPSLNIEELVQKNIALEKQIQRFEQSHAHLDREYSNLLAYTDDCERHTGERTLPFAEFSRLIKGHCLFCEIEKVSQLEQRAAAHDKVVEALLKCASHLSQMIWEFGDQFNNLGEVITVPTDYMDAAIAAVCEFQKGEEKL